MRMKPTLYYVLDKLMWIIFVCCGHARADRPRVILTAGTTTIPVGGSVALSCSVEPSAGWEYSWFRWTPDTLRVQVKNDGGLNRIINVTQGGFYQCKGVKETNNLQSYLSHRTTIQITFSNKVVVIRRPNWPQMFSGETITLTCEVQGGETTEWTCDWRIDGSFIHRTDSKDWTFSVSESNGGDYRCLCFPKDDWFSSTEWSEPISLSVLRKPKAHLSTDSTELPAGGNVILTCSLNTSPSSPFSLKYFWYRGEKSPEPVSSQDADFLSNGQMSVSEEGLYWCRGGRGEPVYYTDYSDHVNITKNLSVGSSGPVGSLLFVLLLVALLGGISLIILLLLFWRSKQTKDFRHTRLDPSQSSNQTVNHEVNQSELNASQPEELPVGPEVDTVYAKVKKGATELPVGPEVDTVYAKVKKGATDKFINTVYSQIEGENAGRMELPVDPEEGAVYANVKKGATDKSIDTVYSLIEMKTFGTMKDPHDPQEGAVGFDVKTDSTSASTEISHLKKNKKKTKGKRSRSAYAAVYANESGTAVASDGPMSRKAKSH